MALIYYVGDVPVFEDEAKRKTLTGELEAFNKAVTEGTDFHLTVDHGEIKAQEFERPDFKPIEIGKPLSIEILTVYTGDAPNKFLGKKDLLVVSSVKSVITHNEAPKAINQIVKRIEDNTYYEPSARNQGSPIVYYTPALDMGTILCSFSLVADTFNEETFGNIAGLLSKAGGIPVFAPASSVLLAGSLISGMIGKLGKALFESKPYFRGDLDIRLDSPGQIVAKSRHIAIIDPRHSYEFKDYIPQEVHFGGATEMRLVHKTSKKSYGGDAPYILISLDGRERADLKSFTPTIASASILEKFYGTDAQGQTIEVIQEALELYNDLKYREKANELSKKLNELDENSQEYKSVQKLLEAYKKNIQTELLKL
ncbi:hypothetical protein [Gilvibacter sediminis]|uniref:hypothetical protein n=1 Tax=Gilvibacter sediminis TaxID=379071 RepID=UPI0023505704|nr:hypothetical protein [Gilvibacter sediminis]MDC7996901.1 hypothetical protein [Gilvibacter sediminis]